MSNIDQILKILRPSLRIVAPHSYWFSLVFGVFNVLVGASLLNVKILVKIKFIGIVPIKVWGLIFLVHGLFMLYFLAKNNWKMVKGLNFVGIGIKTTWWLGLLTLTIKGQSPFLLYVWSSLIAFQVIIVIYFTPRSTHENKF